MPRFFATTLMALALPLSLLAADWPQWMGPNRDAVWNEKGILKSFPKGGPKVLWRQPIGGGYAGPAVANGKVYVADKVLNAGAVEPKDPFSGDKTKTSAIERVLCLDAATGKEIWKHEHPVSYQIQYPAGPRCTPNVHDGKVYALGAMGNLCCLDAGTGKPVWEKELTKEYKIEAPTWGFAGHPLVYKNLLICLVGGDGSTVVAFDRNTGTEVWKSLSAPEPGYNSPILIEAGGTTQAVIWTSKSLYGLNPETGSTYWRVPLQPKYGMSIMTPRKHDDYLYAAGIGNVGVVLKLDAARPAVTEVWRGKGEANPKEGVFPVNMTPYIDKGVIYGNDQPGMFRAVDLTSGKRLWESFKPVFGEDKDEDFKDGDAATAFVVRNGDRYFLFSETGDLVIAKLTPKGYEEIDRAHLLEPTTAGLSKRKVVWSHPAFANKCIFVRNDKEIVCASLAE
jgi:outer membrane protein assembly factor BamB